MSLDCESAAYTIVIYYYYSTRKLILILPSDGGGRPSLSMGVQPVPKAVYRTVDVVINTTARGAVRTWDRSLRAVICATTRPLRPVYHRNYSRSYAWIFNKNEKAFSKTINLIFGSDLEYIYISMFFRFYLPSRTFQGTTPVLYRFLLSPAAR